MPTRSEDAASGSPIALRSSPAPGAGPLGGLDIPKRSRVVAFGVLRGLGSAPARCVGPGGLDIPKRSGDATSGALVGLRSAWPLGELAGVGALGPSAGAASGAFSALAWDAASCAGALGLPEPFGNAPSDALGRVGWASCARPLDKPDAVGLREPFACGAVTLGVACCAGFLRGSDSPLRAAEPPEVLPRSGLSVPG
jgi:hypothetical protein